MPSFNYGWVRDPHIDQQVAQLAAKSPAEGASGWADLAKYSKGVDKAYIAPYGNEEDTAFYSTRMNVKQCNGYPHPTYRVDWLLLCLKGGSRRREGADAPSRRAYSPEEGTVATDTATISDPGAGGGFETVAKREHAAGV